MSESSTPANDRSNEQSSPTNDRLTPLLEDWNYIVFQLAKATGLTEDETRHRLVRELDVLGANVCEAAQEWGLEPHVWSDKLSDFYTATDSFLFETLIWSHCKSKEKMRSWILEFLRSDDKPCTKILTHGDGLGIDSCYLAQEGYSVDYYEVSGKCMRFSQALATDAGLNIHNVKSLQALPAASYEYIVQLDVLEHVPKPPEVVKELSRLLKPNGRLIIHAPFWQTDYFLPTHLHSNQKYCGDLTHLFKQFNLIPIADTFLWMPIVLEKVVNGKPLPSLPLNKRLSLALNQALLRLIGMNNCLMLHIVRRVSIGERRAIRKRAHGLITTS